MTLFDDLKRLWKDYIDYYVVGNNELKEITFHAFLGIILTWKNRTYIESADKKSVRLHLFMIQDSRTGKGQLMSALTKLLYEFVPEKSKIRKTVKDNESCLCGTVYRLYSDVDIKNKKKGAEGKISPRSDEVVIKRGILSTLLALIWEEGSVLLKYSAYMDIVTDVFQVVMDEPGHVSKGMRLKTIEYPCNTTIIAGSYMFPEFRKTLITKGFLQRMFLHYKIFGKKEKRDIRIGVNLLKLHKNPEKIKKIIEGIKILVSRIPERRDKDGIVKKYVTFNDEDTISFNNDLEEIYKEYVEYQFVGEKQKILETFYNGLHSLIDKIAAQRAMVLGRGEVIREDMEYGKQMCMMHLNSLLKIFDYLIGGEIVTVPEEREKIVYTLIAQSEGKVIQKRLLEKLLERKKQGKWDLGFNRSLSLIKQMIENKKLHMEKGEHGRNIIIVK